MTENDSRAGASLVGRTLGHYRVLELIGRGGMGEVYRARDEKLDRHVALKRLTPDVVRDEGRRRRFEREARALAALNHPHVATLYGLEEHDGTLLIAMELVEGEALDRRLTHGPLPVREAQRVARQVAEGLEAAHARGIVHRDLKPANLKMTAEGRVKVLDFGLARPFASSEASEDGGTHTATTDDALTRGVVVGTTAYMSPEQARGLPVDRRTDVWAFGATLFELLTARRAFPGRTTSDTLRSCSTASPTGEPSPRTPRPPSVACSSAASARTRRSDSMTSPTRGSSSRTP
jgi:serine/threonine protein kinase